MPRKKASEAMAASSPGRITCPACKSEISADGATLHTLSKYLDELIETAGDVEKLEKAIEELESKLKAEKAKQEAEAKSKPEVKKDETVGPKNGSGKPSSSWW